MVAVAPRPNGPARPVSRRARGMESWQVCMAWLNGVLGRGSGPSVAGARAVTAAVMGCDARARSVRTLGIL